MNKKIAEKVIFINDYAGGPSSMKSEAGPLYCGIYAAGRDAGLPENGCLFFKVFSDPDFRFVNVIGGRIFYNQDES